MTHFKFGSTEHQKRVELFMIKAGQAVPMVPYIPSKDVCILRARLILEEALETIKALGVQVNVARSNAIVDEVTFKDLHFEATGKPDLVEIVDGCADVSVVTIGTLTACGVADGPVLEEVDNNNLEKFGPGGYRDEFGKWKKPPTHPHPRIQALLDRQHVIASA